MNAKEDKAYMDWWRAYGEMAEPEIEYPAWKAGRAYQRRFEKEQASQQSVQLAETENDYSLNSLAFCAARL